MKKLFVLTLILFSTLSMHAQQSIAGIWNTGKKNTKVEISAAGGGYEGRIASSDNAKAEIGKLLLKDIQSVNGVWKGKLFAAKRGEWMDAVLEERGDKLAVTVHVGSFSKTLKWSKE